MAKGINIEANGLQVEVRYGGAAGDFISLTDIAKYRTAENPGYVIQNWMRTRNTVRFLGLWEHFHNPEFNYLEFEAIEQEAGLNSFVLTPNRIHTDAIKEHLIPEDISARAQSFIYANEADVLNVALFGKTARMWRDEHPESKGNIRDEASLRELIVLVNLESMNAELIKLGLSRPDRAARLNKMAIEQLRVLDETDDKRLLEG